MMSGALSSASTAVPSSTIGHSPVQPPAKHINGSLSHGQDVLKQKLVAILASTTNGCLSELGYFPGIVPTLATLEREAALLKADNVKMFEDNRRLAQLVQAQKDQLDMQAHAIAIEREQFRRQFSASSGGAGLDKHKSELEHTRIELTKALADVARLQHALQNLRGQQSKNSAPVTPVSAASPLEPISRAMRPQVVIPAATHALDRSQPESISPASSRHSAPIAGATSDMPIGSSGNFAIAPSATLLGSRVQPNSMSVSPTSYHSAPMPPLPQSAASSCSTPATPAKGLPLVDSQLNPAATAQDNPLKRRRTEDMMPYHQSTMPYTNATAPANTPANQVEVSNPESSILHGWRIGSEAANQSIPMEGVASSQPPPTTPTEEEDEDEDDDIDADGLPSVQSCIDVIFTTIDGLPVKRICQLCRMRFEKGATTQDAIPYLEPSQDIMLAHCISEHPAAWQRLRDTTAH